MRLSENAVADARRRFGLERQAETYLDWYQEIIRGFNKERLYADKEYAQVVDV
jgi:hypothetical protein